MTPPVNERLQRLWKTPATWFGRVGSVDHKIIGLRYLATALVFLLVGGVEALVMRIQLSHAEAGVVSAEAYAQLFTMHGITMLFLFALPALSGFSRKVSNVRTSHSTPLKTGYVSAVRLRHQQTAVNDNTLYVQKHIPVNPHPCLAPVQT